MRLSPGAGTAQTESQAQPVTGRRYAHPEQARPMTSLASRSDRHRSQQKATRTRPACGLTGFVR